MKKIIGLTGKKRAGKDSAASFMDGYKKISFADPMREIMYRLCIIPEGWDYNENKEDEVLILFDDLNLNVRMIVIGDILLKNEEEKESLYSFIKTFKNRLFSAREFLQKLGTEWVRKTISEDLWVNYSLKKAKQTEGNVVFADVRYDNEAKAIIDAGGEVVLIKRKGQEESGDTHESEKGIDEKYVSTTISASNLDELERYIKDMIM